jgi:hypothetical protein
LHYLVLVQSSGGGMLQTARQLTNFTIYGIQ